MLINDRNELGRRSVLAMVGGLAVTAAFGGRAFALTTGQAQAHVESVVADVLKAVNSGGPEARVLAEFKRVFQRAADVPTIARSVLGVAWRSATPQQRNDFTVAYQDFLANQYGRQFQEYRGSTVKVTKATDQGDKGVLVSSSVSVPGQKSFAIDWQVSDRSGSVKLFNIFIEGVSMLATGRSEVGAMLEANGGSVDKLIAHLRSKT